MSATVSNSLQSALNLISQQPRMFAISIAIGFCSDKIPSVTLRALEALEDLLGKTLSERSRVVFYDDQNRVRTGPINVDEVIKVFSVLKKYQDKGIIFDIQKIHYCLFEPGVCSAKSLDFLSFCIEKSCFNKLNKKDSFNLISSWRYEKNLPDSEISLRSRQMAFNSVRVIGKRKDNETSIAKIASLVAFHSFKIQKATRLYDLRVENLPPEDLVDLPTGNYVVRMYKPNSNSPKKEQFGHTMAYMKVSKDYGIYYDPGAGLTEIKGVNKQGEKVNQIILNVFRKWNVSKTRLYKVFPTNSKPYTFGQQNTHLPSKL